MFCFNFQFSPFTRNSKTSSQIKNSKARFVIYKMQIVKYQNSLSLDLFQINLYFKLCYLFNPQHVYLKNFVLELLNKFNIFWIISFFNIITLNKNHKSRLFLNLLNTYWLLSCFWDIISVVSWFKFYVNFGNQF